MLFGGRCNYSNRDPADLVAAMKPRMVRDFPATPQRDASTMPGAAASASCSTAYRPSAGSSRTLYYLQGYCGHGVNVSHIAAEIVSDAICGTTEKFDLFEQIRHIRLPVGRWAGNQMLALGMLYYRVKDAM